MVVPGLVGEDGQVYYFNLGVTYLDRFDCSLAVISSAVTIRDNGYGKI